jgi:hypothetical protein
LNDTTIGTFGSLLYFCVFFISFGVSEDASSTTKQALSLFFPCALSFGDQVLVNLAIDGQGDKYTTYNGYSLFTCHNMVIILAPAISLNMHYIMIVSVGMC